MTERSTEKESEPKSTVSLFDIDNTLIEGFSIMLFAQHLNRTGIVTDQIYSQMQSDLRLPRGAEEQYRNFAQAIVNHFYSELGGKSTGEIEQEGLRFLVQYQTSLKPYARELVDVMKEQGELIAVSGAPKEAFEPLAVELGIEKLYLLEGETVNGIYTGLVKINMALGDEKQKAVREIIAASFNRELAFAFGDHLDHDSPILDVVSNPFFILGENDPDRELKTRAALAKGYIPVTQNNIIAEVKKRITEIEQKK